MAKRVRTAFGEFAKVQFTSNFDKFEKSFSQQIIDRAHEGANTVRNYIVKDMAKQKTGKTYFVPSRTKSGRRKKRGTHRTYRASSPGQSPAIRSGALRASIFYKVNEERTGFSLKKDLVIWIGSDLEYAPWMEHGTRKNKTGPFKIMPRPFLNPAIDATRGKLRKIFGKKMK